MSTKLSVTRDPDMFSLGLYLVSHNPLRGNGNDDNKYIVINNSKKLKNNNNKSRRKHDTIFIRLS